MRSMSDPYRFHLLTTEDLASGLTWGTLFCTLSFFCGGGLLRSHCLRGREGTGQLDKQPACSFIHFDLEGIGPRAPFRGSLFTLVICE